MVKMGSKRLIMSTKQVFMFFLLTGTCMAVQLDNWRQPFYFAAVRGGLAYTAPSSMFWDDCTGASAYDSLVWFNKEILSGNHLIVEPGFQMGYDRPDLSEQRNYYLHGELLNQIRFYNILIRQTADIDSRFDYDAYYPGHRDRGAKGRIEEAYCQVDWKYGFFRLGRLNRNWGPFPDRSLVVSSNPYTYDAFEWQIHSRLFEFRHLFTAFPFEKNYWDADDGNRWNRYFSAHSLSIMIGNWITAGITETVLFTRERTLPDFQYVNPISIYTVTNTNQEGEGNLMLSFQWDIHPFTHSVALKGQVAFDDFQVDNELITDKEPTHWGIDCGVFWYNPLPSFHLQHSLYTQFTNLSEWMYTVPDNNSNRGERYTYLRKSLGYPENDVTRFNSGIQVIGKNYWFANIEFAYENKGLNQPTSRWNDSYNIPGLPFDTAASVREKTFEATMNARGYFSNYVDGLIGFTACWIKNKNHLSTENYTFEPQLRAEISLHFSNAHVKLP
jgi:hypothetical protein